MSAQNLESLIKLGEEEVKLQPLSAPTYRP